MKPGDSRMVRSWIEDEFVSAVDNISKILGTKYPLVSAQVHQSNCEQTDRMVTAICLYAFIFQQLISQHYSQAASPTEMESEGRTSSEDVLAEWNSILEINPYPIFDIAIQCVDAMMSDRTEASKFCGKLIAASNSITNSDPFAAQYIAGEIFGTLIADKKMLASFYTKPVAAALLSELVVSRLPTDWSDISDIGKLRIADFSCGTGMLLSSVYQRVRSKFAHAGGNPEDTHRIMLENVLFGADIIPSAVDITAASLFSVYPHIDISETNTHVMPYGDFSTQIKSNTTNLVDTVRIGSLEFINDNSVPDLFRQDSTDITDNECEKLRTIEAEEASFDIVIMNPPYTTPTNHKIKERQKAPLPNFAAFGTTTNVQKAMNKRAGNIFREMEKRLKVKTRNGYAGMGTDFFDLAYAKVKPGGTIGFVLSASMLWGAGWQSTRDLLSKHYQHVMIITVSTSESFSSSTAMNEVLVVATKKEDSETSEPSMDNDWTWITLHALPSSTLEAVQIAKEIKQLNPEKNETLSIYLGYAECGHITLCDRTHAPAMIRSEKLIKAIIDLTNPNGSKIHIRKQDKTVSLPLCKLSELGKRGPVGRDIYGGSQDKNRGGFYLSDISANGPPGAPILWNHNSLKETRLTVPIDKIGIISEGKEQEASKLWETATRLHFNLGFRMGSQPLAACLTEEKSIGGVAWPSFTLQPIGSDRTYEEMRWVYPVLLWANSTLGLISFYIAGSRNQYGRSRLTITRLPELLVLDPRQLTAEQLHKSEIIFNRFKDKEFQPANMADKDPIRQELDESMIIELLGYDKYIMEELCEIRNIWCDEPNLYTTKRDR